MIERFNFYDIYGYFLPGTALLAFSIAPVAILTPSWPAPDLTWILVGVPVAYLVGHLLQQVAIVTFHTATKDDEGRLRYPSDILLGDSNPRLSQAMRKEITGHFRESHGLEIGGPISEHSDKRARERRDVFFLCRKRLADQGAAHYVEQYQGMYTLMLGVATAGCIGGSLSLGSWIGVTLNNVPDWLSVIVVAAASAAVIILLLKRQDWNVTLWVLVGTAAGVGFLLGSRGEQSALTMLGIWGVSLLGFFVARRCYRSFRYFEDHFAASVYRDFLALLDSEKTASRAKARS